LGRDGGGERGKGYGNGKRSLLFGSGLGPLVFQSGPCRRMGTWSTSFLLTPQQKKTPFRSKIIFFDKERFIT
jgi:hypothetical protein